MKLPGSYIEQMTWVHNLVCQERYQDALKFVEEMLNDNPADDKLVFYAAFCIQHGYENYGLAFNLWMQCIELNPNRWETFNNIGECLHFLWEHKHALTYLHKALKMNPSEPGIMVNIAVCHLWLAEPEKTIEWCNKILAMEPDHAPALDNLSLAQLMVKDWSNGWNNYEISLGLNYRKKLQYHFSDENGNDLGSPTWWNGEPNQVVVVSGEQGIGDEIMFASCIPDLVNCSQGVVLDCFKKLEGLFQRSFPQAEVRGTRHDVDPVWTQIPTAATSLGTLPKFFRNNDSDFPGTPYLKACPIRSAQWKDFFSKIPGLKIGIAWNGGTRNTGKSHRDIPLEMWDTLLTMDNVTIIDLEYDDPTNEISKSGYDIKHYPWATMTNDYDDTAALVSQLDLVISTTTSIVHLAGGLGVECWCLTPYRPNWRFTLTDDELIWTNSVKIIRQEKDQTWKDVIDNLKDRLNEYNICRNGSEASDSRLGSNEQHSETLVNASADGALVPGTHEHNQEGANGVHVCEVSGTAPDGLQRRRVIPGQRHDRDKGYSRTVQVQKS